MVFTQVDTAQKRLDDHLPYAGEAAVADVRRLAQALLGARVLHVSSTPYGGGVAELLHTIVPLMRDAGLDAQWFVLDGAPLEFFEVTKKIHNTLQGMEDALTPEEWTLYGDVNRSLAAVFPEGPWDFVVIHDPQPLLAGVMARLGCSRRKGRGRQVVLALPHRPVHTARVNMAAPAPIGEPARRRYRYQL